VVTWRRRDANQHRSFSTIAGVIWGISIAAATSVFFSIFLLAESVRQADRLAIEQQRSLVENALAQSIDRVAHDQESSTIWTEAARQVKAPQLDYTWLDGNLGVWFYTYYDHDEVFLVNRANQPVYAVRAGRRVAPTLFNSQLAAIAAPLIADLKRQRARPSVANGTLMSPGSADFAIVSGHPAIVSVKPIIPERGSSDRSLDAGFMHVSVVFLDGSFARSLTRGLRIDDPAFVLSPPANLPWVELRSRDGRVLSYLAWSAFQPGTLISRDILPVMACAMILVGTIIFFLVKSLRGRTLELHASEAQAKYFASHDPLTGLANRSLFHERVRRELLRARADSRQVAYLYLDLDGFKAINDTYGHAAGDDLIRIVATEISGVVADQETVARVGGDEFAILLIDMRDLTEVEALCARLAAVFESPFHIGESTVSVGVSIGIALAGRDLIDATELARKADIAMYEAKAAGGGWAFFSPAMDASRRGRREMADELRAALQSGDELTVHYQPIFTARGLQLTGIEALARWRHPTRGWIDPSTFIRLAEECGLIDDLGVWMLRQACAAARSWPIETIAVNASAVQFRDPDFADRVLTILAEVGLQPGRLEIEITETAMIDNAAACGLNMSSLHAAGVVITLDDFGTGYSSFSHLNGFPIDRVKIDRSLVAATGPGGEGQSIVRWIVNIAKASGLKVTAKGIETNAQQQFLSRIGVTDLQGNYLGEALPAEQISDLLRAPGSKVRSPRRQTRIAASPTAERVR
jgi:diguanylate cyclase (GGDEF)-like protein